MNYYSVQKMHKGEWINWYSPFESRLEAEKMRDLHITLSPRTPFRVTKWHATRQLDENGRLR